MSTRTPLPERPRRYRFALTPLADAMFQLLIFFMLSTSLTPYSLINLKTAADEAPDEGDAPSGGAEDAPPADPGGAKGITLWTVGNGSVTTSGQRYDMAQLGELASAIGDQDAEGQVILLITEQARVQDVATALEALEDAAVSEVQIAREGS